ncbi:MAG TPA: stalk domain-containing protein [Syntrophomonas sp.]|nr:stalk domain-containing protein [Syntrophomonas sp.]
MTEISKWLLALTVFICLMATPAFSAPTIDINGQQLTFDVPPTIEDGCTLVPLRTIFEAMGATVGWDQDTRTATAVKDETTVVLQIGSTAPTINGQVKQLDVPAKIIDGRTLAPLRFVGEAFGCTVDWDQASQLISITSVPASDTPPPSEDIKNIKVHYIDVGQADSIYIQLPDHNDILIDGGSEADAETVVNYLKSHGVDDIELMIATHPHEDHIGGLPGILEAFTVEEILDSGVDEEVSEVYNKYSSAAKAEGCTWVSDSFQKYTFGDTTLKILTGSASWSGMDDDSVVCRLDTGEIEFLFTGDVGMRARNILKGDISAEILKINNHGSIASISSNFLKKVKPEAAIISVGADNSYAHPSALTLFDLKTAGVSIYRTDLNGNIIVTTDRISYSVYTNKNLPAPAKPEAGKFVGGVRSNQYHQPSCERAQSIAPEDQVWFISEDEAIHSGYLPCHECIEITDQDLFDLEHYLKYFGR